MKADRSLVARVLLGLALWGVSSLPALAKGPDLGLGKKVFVTNCAACHGLTGQGNGPASSALNPRPRNFVKQRFQFGDRLPQVEHTIATGIKGSAMPSWKATLSPAKIRAVAQYVLAIHHHQIK